MKNFDLTFAKAIRMILVEDKEKDKEKDKNKTQQKGAMDVIVWPKGSRGKGNWNNIIKGLKKEADSSYEEAYKGSLAAPGKARMLMSKLGVAEPSKSQNSLAACAQILSQAFKNPTMSEAYGSPTVTGNRLFIPFKSIDEDDQEKTGDSGEVKSSTARNLTAYIHLTLVGAYNARFLNFVSPVYLSSTAENANGVTIISR